MLPVDPEVLRTHPPLGRVPQVRLSAGRAGDQLVGTVWLFNDRPKGFFPSEDRGYQRGITEAVEGSPTNPCCEHQRPWRRSWRRSPKSRPSCPVAGSRGTSGRQHRGVVGSSKLKDRKDRPPTAGDALVEGPGLNCQSPASASSCRCPRRPSASAAYGPSLYQYTLQAEDPDELYEVAPKLESKLRELPGLQDVTSDLLLKNPRSMS